MYASWIRASTRTLGYNHSPDAPPTVPLGIVGLARVMRAATAARAHYGSTPYVEALFVGLDRIDAVIADAHILTGHPNDPSGWQVVAQVPRPVPVVVSDLIERLRRGEHVRVHLTSHPT